MAMPWDIVGNVIDKIIPDKAQRDQAKIKMLDLQQSGAFKEEEMRYSAVLMEAQSKDPWTSRARPAFLYVMYVFLLTAMPFGALYAINPVIADNVSVGVGAWLEAIPEEMWWLFGAGYLGYVKKRSDDKQTILNPAASKSFLQKIF